ncbi:hypothetical protein [Methylobrevis pamukkalensis]|uniref:Mor transcription activator family protein n=1 Tax=Methylobrevis pamukkalensis TaxID=1439726 RepID=A0A1E3H4F5_9HYPH|nr:hypothetical protein [Methylobrevis pamukkalensis]ODN71194.1 hypothetical protein A6302_01483 [Methylobrevis pamukkalensis]
MSASWLPAGETLPGILADIAAVGGVQLALAFGATHGGAERYIPDPDSIDRDHWMAKALGVKVARLVAAKHARNTVTIPNARNFSNAVEVRRLWAEGKSMSQIRRETKLTRVTVKRLIGGAPQGVASDGGAAAAEPDFCPACGRRHRKPTAATPTETDDRQMAFPFDGRSNPH